MKPIARLCSAFFKNGLKMKNSDTFYRIRIVLSYGGELGIRTLAFSVWWTIQDLNPEHNGYGPSTLTD